MTEGVKALWDGPLIVVGASRSGTAMLRSILNRHPSIFLAGETHFFDDLRPRFVQGPIAAEDRRKCADYFRALDDRPYGMAGKPEKSPLAQSEFIERAEGLGSGIDGYFETYCRLRAEATGKTVWGEKTPRHVFRIRECLEAFPQARVICMVRDPRSVVLSYRDWRNQGGLNSENDPDFVKAIKAEEQRAHNSYDIVISTLLWRGSVNSAYRAVRSYGKDKIFILRYEDVIDDPSRAIDTVCRWLGLTFDPAMLQIPMLNSSFTPFSQSSGISSAAMERWRSSLSGYEIGIVQRFAGRTLTNAGYERFGPVASIPAAAAAALRMIPSFFRALFANRHRMGNIPSYIVTRIILLLR